MISILAVPHDKSTTSGDVESESSDATEKSIDKFISESSYEEVKKNPGYIALASLIYVLLFFVIPTAHVMFSSKAIVLTVFSIPWRISLFPLFYIIQQILIFETIWWIVILVGHYQELIPAFEPDKFTSLCQRLSRATGQKGRDFVLFLVSAILFIYLVISGLTGVQLSWEILPLVFVCTQTFLGLMLKAKKDLWVVKPYSSKIPASLADIPSLPDEGETVDLAWEFPILDSNIGQAEISFQIPESDFKTCQALNDTKAVSHEHIQNAINLIFTSMPTYPMQAIALKVHRMAQGMSMSLYDLLGCCLALVQSIEIEPNDISLAKEGYNSPIESLYSKSGSNADRGILLFAILVYLFPKDKDNPENDLSIELWLNSHKKTSLVAIGNANLLLPDNFYTDSGKAFYILNPASDGAVGRLPLSKNPSSFQKYSFRPDNEEE